ncbi:MAG: hypothetical protein ACKOYM_11515 [Actinomycetes bacterium]
MSQSCVQHPSMRANAPCGQCGHLFCDSCLIYPFGERQPPMCVGCALAAGGVRRKRTNRPKLRSSVIRSRQRDQRIEAATPTTPSEVTNTDPAPEPVATSGSWIGDDGDDVSGAWRQVF